MREVNHRVSRLISKLTDDDTLDTDFMAMIFKLVPFELTHHCMKFDL